MTAQAWLIELVMLMRDIATFIEMNKFGITPQAVNDVMSFKIRWERLEEFIEADAGSKLLEEAFPALGDLEKLLRTSGFLGDD